MILSYKRFCLNETRGRTINPSLFTVDERDLFDDLLTEYIDKYNMVEMKIDDEGCYYYDEDLPRIQYCVQRLRNIGIDIESPLEIPIRDIFIDLKDNFLPRVERYGYNVYHCSEDHSSAKNEINITIMQGQGKPGHR